jgi:hypothetical protein
MIGAGHGADHAGSSSQSRSMFSANRASRQGCSTLLHVLH